MSNNPERTKISEIAASWADAVKYQNEEQLSNVLSQDSVLFHPGSVVRGKKAVMGFYKQIFESIEIDVRVEIIETEVFGDNANVWCKVKGIFNPRNGGKPIPVSNNNLWFVIKENGNWKINRGMSVSELSEE